MQNSAEQICRVADFMYEYTVGVDGWRSPSAVPSIAPDQTFTWPLRGSLGPKFIDL